MRERIENHYWKLRRYYWKYKFLIRKAAVTAINSVSSKTLPFRKARSLLYWKSKRGYDNGRVFFIRQFWKIKAVFDYVAGYFIGYLRHFTVIGYWKLHRLFKFLKAKAHVILEKLKRSGSIKNAPVFYPLKKVYWFFNYQAQKRIYPVFRKKTKID